MESGQGEGLAARQAWSEALGVRPHGRRWAKALKRTLDVVGALVFFGLFWWLFAAVWLAAWITTGGPVIYRHERIGLDGKPFQCLKFRSMVRDSDRVLAEHLESVPAAR